MVVEFSSLFYGATERPDSGHGFGIGIRQSVAFISIVEAMDPEFFMIDVIYRVMMRECVSFRLKKVSFYDHKGSKNESGKTDN